MWSLVVGRKQKWKSSQADAGNFEDSSDFYDESSAKDFDLTLKPRVFITSGPINKREPGAENRDYFIISNII